MDTKVLPNVMNGTIHSAWWPGISKDLEAEVKRCTTCCKAQEQFNTLRLLNSAIPTPILLLTINSFKSMLARHEIPQVGVSDNGPQYSTAVFPRFANNYGFVHDSSSKHPQANGEAERAVGTIKGLLKKCSDKAE